MKIKNEFTVGVPIDEAWNAMLDLERIAPCLPGAAITDQDSEDEYQGTMTVKIGPITAKYKGTVEYKEKDESSHRAVLNATGRDARGQGTASATITSQMEEVSDGTKVSVETDMKLTGKAAQFGRGIAQDVAGKMLGQFADCLEQRLGGDGADSATEEGAAEVSDTPAETATASENGSESAPSAAAAASTGGAVTPNAAPAGAASGSMASPVTGTGSMAAPVEASGDSGSSTSDGAASGDAAASEEKPKSRKISQPDPEPLDLGEMSQDAIFKRAKPVLIGVGALLAVFIVIRRLRRRG